MKRIRGIVLVVVLLVTTMAVYPPAPTSAAPYYYRWTGWDTPTCSTASGGSFSTGTRHYEWDLPAGAELFVTFDANGSAAETGPFALPTGTGAGDFGSFGGSGLGAYPFYYAIKYVTVVDGVPVYRSTGRIDCTADGPGVVTITNGVPVIDTGEEVILPVPGPMLPNGANLVLFVQNTPVLVAPGSVQAGENQMKACQTAFVINTQDDYSELFVMGGWVPVTSYVDVPENYGQSGTPVRPGCETR